jgi:hypothetical protein
MEKCNFVSVLCQKDGTFFHRPYGEIEMEPCLRMRIKSNLVGILWVRGRVDKLEIGWR